MTSEMLLFILMIINRLSAIYIVYRQRDIFWVSLFQIIYVISKLFVQKIPGVHNIRK